MTHDCATCQDTRKTPCSMHMNGTNDKPCQVQNGPCPVCSNGNTCPQCFHDGGMDDDNIEPKCRFCGWSAAGDRHRAALELVTHDELARLHRRIKNMRKSPLPDEIVFANLCAEGWGRDAVAKAMEAK